jgi:hypothetical protein
VDKLAFITAFDQATARCRSFAQRYVIEGLPTTVRFDFEVYGRTPNNKGQIKYLGGRLLTREQLCGVEPIQARKYLWIDGKIPLWINLSVQSVDGDFTFIEVHACNRVTDDDGKLYYTRDGTKTPFQILGPRLPPGWVSLVESGKFSLGVRSAK